MASTTTTELDTSRLFTDEGNQLALIQDALDSRDAGYIAHAIGTVARARGMSSLEGDTGIKRQVLHKALQASSNPTLKTLMPVLEALGLRLTVQREPEPA